MNQGFEVGIANRPHGCRETILMMTHGQSAVERLFRRVTYLTIDEEHFLMYLSKFFSEARRVCSVWLGQEEPTQELSETDSIRGAKLEVGILGVVVPLMDGVFSPCATDTSASLFGSPRIVQHMMGISVS